MNPRPMRLAILMLVVLIVGGAVFFRMRGMIFQNGADYATTAESKSTKTLTVYGMRGTIYDTNMMPVAYDRTSYDISFYRDPSKTSDAYRENYTKVIIRTIELVESLGKTTIDTFWLVKDEDGVWRFNTGATSEAVEATRERQWRENFYVKYVPEADLWRELNAKYFIPDDLSEEMKVKVLAIWQASRMSAFTSQPVVIANDVGFECVTRVEALAVELDGISVRTSSERVYPQGSTASHAIGYISKITDDGAMATYSQKGYPIDATVGVAGIEYSMEDQLSQYVQYRQGSRTVEVDTRGKVVREIAYTEPQDGNSIVLTIDTDLQNVMAEALASTIQKINREQRDVMATDRWQRQNADVLEQYAEQGKEVALAETGGMIAMDPNSGRVLGMVSHPDFDLSLFEGGISGSEWSYIINNENNPLYNRVISAKDTPGSIFKLCTALGALGEGTLTLSHTIDCLGSYTDTDPTNPARCWVRDVSLHQNQTIVEGIKNSCNYFFYKTGHELGSEKINKWAAALGLTSRTNIELPSEAMSFAGNQTTLYDPDRAIADQYTAKPIFIANAIKATLLRVGEDRGIEYDDERVDEAVKSLLDIVTKYDLKADWYVPIREILLYDMNIPSEYIASRYMVNTFVTYLQDLFWTPNETIMLAIGQSITQVTPVAVARYVSAIVNGGTVYDAQIIDKIVSANGEVILEKDPVVANQIAVDPAYFAAIRKGMEDATSVEDGGTAAKELASSKYKIAAKTGTSERTELDVENNSWLVCFAPAEDPKIVVVVYIQNGYGGVKSSAAAKATIEYYLDNLGGYDSTAVEADFTLGD
ncbi:MAG: penicillin-binding transpeptidase domain-containing protein [Christensenellales bacterium]|jgi:penicillin-binding protein 2